MNADSRYELLEHLSALRNLAVVKTHFTKTEMKKKFRKVIQSLSKTVSKM